MIVKLAKTLDDGLIAGREIERLTASYPQLSAAEAYSIQDEGIRLRRGRGEKLIGLKMGFTSEAKRKQMNLGAPIYGVLTDRMRVEDGGVFELKGKIHPKIEPEIAFVMKHELKGRVSKDEAAAACGQVCAAMEILDSRFVGFKYFSLPYVVADNCSSSYFVLGRALHDATAIDVGDLRMSMEINGSVVQADSSKAISGHPLNSVVQLCELLAQLAGLGASRRYDRRSRARPRRPCSSSPA